MSITVMNICDVMKERKSVRVYDPGKKIEDNIVYQILDYAGAAPSSWNLQHWKFIIISDELMKEKILPIAYNQEQVKTCSHLLIVLGDKEAYRNATDILSEQVKNGLMTKEAMEAQINSIMYAYEANNEKYGTQDAIRNASLASMQIMLAAKSFEIDSCPMLSFKESELIEALSIPDRYIPVMMVSLGYGVKKPYETMRFPVDKVILQHH